VPVPSDLPAEQFLTAANTNLGRRLVGSGVGFARSRTLAFSLARALSQPAMDGGRTGGRAIERRARGKMAALLREGWGVDEPQLSSRFNPSHELFRDKIVFIGNKPKTSVPDDGETDEFRTPYTRWTGESAGGVEILATEFLESREWRLVATASAWIEAVVLVLAGVLLGWGLLQVRFAGSLWDSRRHRIDVALVAVLLSYFSNFWFPWLVIAGGQVPCAFAWTVILPWRGGGGFFPVTK